MKDLSVGCRPFGKMPAIGRHLLPGRSARGARRRWRSLLCHAPRPALSRGGLVQGLDPARVDLEVLHPRLGRRVGAEELRLAGTAELRHLLPDAYGAARIVAGARCELDADPVGL